MPACILYFFILSAPCALLAAYGRRCEETLPFSLFALLLTQYIAGLCGLLPYGVTAALLLAAACFVLSAIRILRKKVTLRFAVSNLFTPAFTLFMLLFAVAVVCNIGRSPYHGDEFSHWAYTVKAMLYNNDLGTAPAAASLYASYPPGMSLLQYCIMHLSRMTGGPVYTEWLLFVPYQTTAFALVACAAGKGRTWKNALPVLPLAAVAVLLPALLYPLFYESLFVDPIIGLLTGYLLSVAWRTEKYDALTVCTVCCGLAVLTLLKDAGLFFAIVCAAVLILDLRGAAKPLRSTARTGILLCIAAAKASWALHIRMRNVPVRFSQTAPLSTLPGILTGADTSFRRTAFLNFLHAPFEKRIPLGADTFTVLGKTVPGWQFYISFLLLTAVTLLLLYAAVAGYGRHTQTRVRRRRIAATVTLGLVLYWVGLCGLYTLKFVAFEAVQLYCYERYLAIPFLAICMLLFSAFSGAITGRLRLLPPVLLLAAMLAVAPLHSVYPYLTRRSARGSAEMMEPQREIAARVTRIVPAESRLYLLRQDSDGEGIAQKYLLYPRIVEGGAIGPPMYEGDTWSKDITSAEWQETLASGYDYVLLSHVDTLFIERCSDAFDAPETIADGELYAVHHDTGKLAHIAVQ